LPERDRRGRSLAIAALLAFLCLRSGSVAPTAGESSQPAAAGIWQDATAETGAAAIGGRAQFDLVDAPDGTLYLYGGVAGGRPLDDLWTLPPGGRWQRVEPAGAAPPALIEPHLAVDSAGRLYEFGGLRGDGALVDDLYRYDPGQGWTDLTPSIDGPRPPPRQDHGFVYSAAGGDALYVFGGDGGRQGRLNDFWRYDLTTGRWTDLTEPSGAVAIQPRELYDLTDDGRGHLYLFGGTIDGGDGYSRRLNDFWRYDVVAGRWDDLTDESGSAMVPGRHYYGQAADDEGDFYVLGGYLTPESGAEAGEAAGDLWAYRLQTGRWVNLTPAAAPLLPRVPYALARAGDGGLALFGGAQLGVTTGAPSDFWVWDPRASREESGVVPHRVGSAGGEARSADGSLALALPVGALVSEREVGLAWTSLDPAPDGSTIATFSVTIGGDPGVTLDRRADLRVRVDVARGAPISRFSVLHRRGSDGQWSPVPGSRVQSDGRTLAARVLAGGDYAIVGRSFPTLLLPLIPGAAATR
jgi:hypothetical protein